MPASPGHQSPSPMLEYLDDALQAVLPDEEYAKLTQFDEAIARTTSRGDFHRCLHCAHWAVSLADHPQNAHTGHLVESLRTVVDEIRDTSYAVDFGLFTPGRTVTDVELAWVDRAMQTAEAVAASFGWDAVPWQNLVEELVAMEPASS
ncbi:MAG: hypothetical protein M0013_03475 [Actinomycetota bacterium]|nr:hypothetical protein [Actinomycetota bacterium]